MISIFWKNTPWVVTISKHWFPWFSFPFFSSFFPLHLSKLLFVNSNLILSSHTPPLLTKHQPTPRIQTTLTHAQNPLGQNYFYGPIKTTIFLHTLNFLWMWQMIRLMTTWIPIFCQLHKYHVNRTSCLGRFITATFPPFFILAKANSQDLSGRPWLLPTGIYTPQFPLKSWFKNRFCFFLRTNIWSSACRFHFFWAYVKYVLYSQWESAKYFV